MHRTRWPQVFREDLVRLGLTLRLKHVKARKKIQFRIFFFVFPESSRKRWPESLNVGSHNFWSHTQRKTNTYEFRLTYIYYIYREKYGLSRSYRLLLFWVSVSCRTRSRHLRYRSEPDDRPIPPYLSNPTTAG